jgi:hypothetical protein
MQPSGPHLQRITRSSRSRPSLHQSASKCVQWHRTCARTRIRTRKMGCGTCTLGLGDSRQAAAREPRSPRTSSSKSKSAASRSRQGAAEAAGRLVQQLLRCQSPSRRSTRVVCASWPLFRASGARFLGKTRFLTWAKQGFFLVFERVFVCCRTLLPANKHSDHMILKRERH